MNKKINTISMLIFSLSLIILYTANNTPIFGGLGFLFGILAMGIEIHNYMN